MTKTELSEWLDYNPETGVFVWLKDRRPSIKAGDVAGTLSGNGYCQICFKGKIYLAHRLAWFFYFGVWPYETIDHINRSKTDNRIVNLRDVPQRVNSQNIEGFSGVTYHRRDKVWIARIRLEKGSPQFTIASCKKKSDAIEAYQSFIKRIEELEDDED